MVRLPEALHTSWDIYAAMPELEGTDRGPDEFMAVGGGRRGKGPAFCEQVLGSSSSSSLADSGSVNPPLPQAFLMSLPPS